MVTVSTADLRAHLSEYLDKAANGEAVHITNRNELMAVLLSPTQAKLNAIQELRGCLKNIKDVDLENERYERLLNK